MRSHYVLAFLCLGFGAATLATAAPGKLDPAFGTGGIVITTFGNNVRPLDVALQGDGKLVVVGGLDDFRVASQVAFVVRYLPDGTLDPSFGRNGLATIALTDFQNEAEAVVIQANGRIVVLVRATTADGSVTEWALVRLKSSGTPDLTFGSGGRTFISFPHPQFFHTPVDVLLLQPDDKLLVGGAVLAPRRNPTPPKTALARFTATGRPDTTFGSNGVAEAVAIGAPDALAVFSDHSILAVNFYQQTAQFTSSGALLSRVIGGMLGTGTHAGTTIFRPDGEFLVAGAGRGPTGRRDLDVTAHLFKATGDADPDFQPPLFDFGAGGPYSNLPQAIALGANGEIVIGGLSQTPAFNDFGVARLHPNGSLDSKFGNGGTLTTTFPHGGQVLAILVQPDRKIVAVGQSFSNDTAIPVDLALLRYLGE